MNAVTPHGSSILHQHLQMLWAISFIRNKIGTRDIKFFMLLLLPLSLSLSLPLSLSLSPLCHPLRKLKTFRHFAISCSDEKTQVIEFLIGQRCTCY